MLVFPCLEETHSLVAPLTLEGAKRSCRNKCINKQQGESPGFSLEVAFYLSLPLSLLCVRACACVPCLNAADQSRYIFFYKILKCILLWLTCLKILKSASICYLFIYYWNYGAQFVTCFSATVMTLYQGTELLTLWLGLLPVSPPSNGMYTLTSCLAGYRPVPGSYAWLLFLASKGISRF